jgi:hypothetical protein
MAGTYTGQQLVDMVLDNLGRSGEATTRSGTTMSTMALRWLNFAQWMIAREEDLLYDERTSSALDGRQHYDFPSDTRAVFSLRVEDGLSSKKLICEMPSNMDKYVPKPNETSEGLPDYYVPFYTNKTFELYRIPDATYVLRLRMSYWPTDITLTTYSSYTRMDDALVAYAVSLGFKYLQELEDAAWWEKEAAKVLGRCIKAEREFLPDWEPEYLGFTVYPPQSVGEYYNDPLQRTSP